MYPQGWSHRAFQPGFRRQEGAAAAVRTAALDAAAVGAAAVGAAAVGAAAVGATGTAVPVPGIV